MIRVEWKADFTILTAIDRNLDDAAQETMWQAAGWLAADIKSHWSNSSPSPFGQPPGVDFGFLDAGVTVDTQGRAGGKFAKATDIKTAFVRIDTSDSGRQYAQAVQTYSGRPFFEPALMRFEQVFADLAAGMWDRIKR